MVEEFTGVRITTDELGGAGDPRPHTPACRASSCRRASRRAAVADLLAYLPSSVDDDPPRWPTDDPVDRLVPGGRAT